MVRQLEERQTPQIRQEALADTGEFYAEYWAGSIGDGHIVIGTPVVVGITVSHGYRVPDLREMSATAASLRPSQRSESRSLHAAILVDVHLRDA